MKGSESLRENEMKKILALGLCSVFAVGTIFGSLVLFKTSRQSVNVAGVFGIAKNSNADAVSEYYECSLWH